MTIDPSIKRFIITSDWHFGCHTNQKIWLAICSHWLEHIFIPWVRKNKQPGDAVLMLGDVYENRKSIDQEIDNKLIELINQLRSEIPVIFLIGNHDIYKKNDNKINALKKFSYLDGVTVLEEPLETEISGKQCAFMPWRNTETSEVETLDKFKPADYLFCHTSISGAKYNKFVAAEHTTEISNFKKFKQIFSGHIHLRQFVHDGRLIYVGTPYQITRSDKDNSKGHWTLEIESGKLDFHENTISPQYKKVDLKEITENYTKSIEWLEPLLKNNWIDFYIESNLINNLLFSEFISYINEIAKSIDTFFIDNHSFDTDELQSTEAVMRTNWITIIEDKISKSGLKKSEQTEILSWIKELYNEQQTV